MFYYNVSLLGSPLEPFTYQSSQNINIGTKVNLKVRNREAKGVVISTCKQPEFDTNDILEVVTIAIEDSHTFVGLNRIIKITVEDITKEQQIFIIV